jgi:hypothetical protein
MRSGRATIPTNLSSRTTGTRLIFLAYMRRATFRAGGLFGDGRSALRHHKSPWILRKILRSVVNPNKEQAQRGFLANIARSGGVRFVAPVAL